MLNLKEELLKGISLSDFHQIKAVDVMLVEDGKSYRDLKLKIGYSAEDYEKWLSNLDWNYNPTDNVCILEGNIWFTDGSCFTNGIIDSHSFNSWYKIAIPEIPDYLHTDPGKLSVTIESTKQVVIVTELIAVVDQKLILTYPAENLDDEYPIIGPLTIFDSQLQYEGLIITPYLELSENRRSILLPFPSDGQTELDLSDKTIRIQYTKLI